MEALRRKSGERRSNGRLTLIAVHVKEPGTAPLRGIGARNRPANTAANASFWK
jgi:hypothetical protein